jgi:hypothetical protein
MAANGLRASQPETRNRDSNTFVVDTTDHSTSTLPVHGKDGQKVTLTFRRHLRAEVPPVETGRISTFKPNFARLSL